MIYRRKSALEQLLLLLLTSLLLSYTAAGQTLVNAKGTKLTMDTTKWTTSGSNIYNKNTGNTGIGISLPLYKLDISATANPLRLTGLQSGAASDSVLTVQNGVVRYASIYKLVTDSSIYKYDGSLASNRALTFNSNNLTFNTGGSAFNITGLNSGTITDSLVTINSSTGKLNRIATSQLLTPEATTISKGTVQLDGDLAGTATSPKVIGIQGVDVSATTPVAGQALVYNGTSWVPATIPTYPTIIKTTTTQASSSTTPTTINTLSFSTAANRSYRIKLWLVYNTSVTTTGIRLGPLAVTGTANYWYNIDVNITATTSNTLSGFNTANVLVATGTRATTGNVALIDMTVEATTAGTVAFQFGAETTGTITIQPNSWLEYEIIK